jgi:uncharacterized membrane protein YfcA
MVNALAGGGTLITFPVMTALGIPPVQANITNTIALCPGYFGGTWAQRKDLRGQKNRLILLIPAAVLGGIGGGILLMMTGEKLFSGIVPWLILMATLLLAFQALIKKWVDKKEIENSVSKNRGYGSALLVFPATIYGGYFGAGLGVILLAVLGLSVKDHMVRLNALKQMLSLSANLAAAVFFLFSDQVHWVVAGVMMLSALLGGYLGGKLAGRMKPEILRWIIVVAGFFVFVFMLLRQ